MLRSLGEEKNKSFLDLSQKNEEIKFEIENYEKNNNLESFSLGFNKETSQKLNNDKENEIPANIKEEEKDEFSLQNYVNNEIKSRKSERKRKSSEILGYYPIFKKLKTSEEIVHKIFSDEKNGFSENSNDLIHMNSIQNNRKITEYFQKQKTQKTFVQNLIINEALKSLNKEDNNNDKQKNPFKTKINKDNLLKHFSLRKINFGDSNSNTDIFVDHNNINSVEKKQKEKNIKNFKLNVSTEKITHENYKLKDEIRKLNKKLVDKDMILKNEESHLRYIINENKSLSEKVVNYEKQIVFYFLIFY